MRRVITTGLLLASVPVGVGVGLWMARLTYLPYCPVRGLGTLALCAARPRFDPRLCVLYGGAAAAFVLLVSIAVRRRASRVGIFDCVAAAAGIVFGLWTSLITYAYVPCGPRQLCLGFLPQRLAVWQSAFLGAGAMMVPHGGSDGHRTTRAVPPEAAAPPGAERMPYCVIAQQAVTIEGDRWTRSGTPIDP